MNLENSPKAQVAVQSLFFLMVFGALGWTLDTLFLKFGLLDHSWAVFWPLNGVTGALLLTRRRQAWPLLLATISAATWTGHVLAGSGWEAAGFDTLINAVEVVIAASILPQFITLEYWLREPNLVYRFILGTFVAAPGAAGLLAALRFHYGAAVPFWHAFHVRAMADALGMASTLPLVLALSNRASWRFTEPLLTLRTGLMLVLMAGTTVGVFAEAQYSLLFVLFPVLAMVMFFTGFIGATLAIELICIISVALTLHHGGIAALGGDPEHRVLFLQLFLSYVILMGFPVSVLLAERRAFAHKLQNRERQYRLLAESSRDVIVLTDLEGKRDFVSPACLEVFGFEPDDLQGLHFHEGIHEDDRALCDSTLQDIRLSLTSSAVLTYRSLTREHGYIWVEGQLRAITDEASGDVTGCLVTLRDITEHKRLQKDLQDACAKLERQASFDALTDVANRRRFDSIFDQEWRRAAREAQSLALLLLDIDHFKSYNDLHGHPAGDECLRQVAAVINALARRPGDLVARYGGEEFIAVLPATDLKGSCELGEKIREAVAQLQLELPTGGRGCTTISIGCAAIVPDVGVDPLTLIEEADRALYLAKANGRNRVEAKPGPRPVRLSPLVFA